MYIMNALPFKALENGNYLIDSHDWHYDPEFVVFCENGEKRRGGYVQGVSPKGRTKTFVNTLYGFLPALTFAQYKKYI